METDDNFQHRNIIDNSNVMIGGGDGLQYRQPIKKVEDTASETRIYITPPIQREHLEPYLHQVKEGIYNYIRTNNILDPHTSYKMYISSFSKYYKYNNQETVEFGGMHHRTPTDTIHAHSGALDDPFLEYVIRNIGAIQIQQQNNMQDSNWIYLGTVQVAIVFIKLLGKPVSIKDYIPYPHARGRDSIINIDNAKRLDRVRDISPCVVVALRAHLLLTDNNNVHRDADLKYLSSKRNGKIKRVYWNKLRKYNVSLPAASVITGEFNFNHWCNLEKANKIPICVHILKSSKSGDGLNIECIRAPTQKIMQTYSPTKICHLLMLNPSHVCYIPNMKSYMKSAFHQYHENRCMFCYLTFNTEIKLDNHLNDGACYNDRKQPTQMILKENQFIPHQNLISEMCPELIFVADCEAMLCKDPNIQNDSDDDDDNNLEGFDNAADNNI